MAPGSAQGTPELPPDPPAPTGFMPPPPVVTPEEPVLPVVAFDAFVDPVVTVLPWFSFESSGSAVLEQAMRESAMMDVACRMLPRPVTCTPQPQLYASAAPTSDRMLACHG